MDCNYNWQSWLVQTKVSTDWTGEPTPPLGGGVYSLMKYWYWKPRSLSFATPGNRLFPRCLPLQGFLSCVSSSAEGAVLEISVQFQSLCRARQKEPCWEDSQASHPGRVCASHVEPSAQGCWGAARGDGRVLNAGLIAQYISLSLSMGRIWRDLS